MSSEFRLLVVLTFLAPLVYAGVKPVPHPVRMIVRRRDPPVDIQPVKTNGVLFSVHNHFEKTFMAVEISAEKIPTGKVLWLRELYRVTYVPDLDPDIQDNYITEFNVDGTSLHLADEHDKVFFIRCKDGKNAWFKSMTKSTEHLESSRHSAD